MTVKSFITLAIDRGSGNRNVELHNETSAGEGLIKTQWVVF
jgi:hypothetical protein